MSQMSSLKNVVTENLDQLLERDHLMDDMMNKATDLGSLSQSISVKSKRVRRQVFWRGVMMKLAFAGIIVVRSTFHFRL